MDLFMAKFDFNITFRRALMRYTDVTKQALTSLPPNWDVAQKAQNDFRDLLFAFCVNKVTGVSIEFLSEEDWKRLSEFYSHSKSSKAVHTCIPNDMLERIINALPKSDSQKNNPSLEVSP